MRILAVTETCDLASLYMRLVADGHAVRVHVSDDSARGTGAGLFERIVDWRAALPWIRKAGKDGIIVFEAVSDGLGPLQDQLRRDGYHVIGGSTEGDRLENDRAYAQGIMAKCGLAIAPVHEFDDATAANVFIEQNPARYVLKFSGPGYASSDNYLGQLADGSDVRAVLVARASSTARGLFILMPYLDGIEVGVGAYFDGDRFLQPACLDWEHKRFFAGDLGELTGEMGTVATFERAEALFELTLAKLAPHFRGRGHAGWINLNTIVNSSGIWPLELTCRFGYPGFAVLEPLQATRWGELFKSLVTRDGADLATRPGYSVGVVLTTPPFPYTRKQVAEPIGLPVVFDAAVDDADRMHFHYGEVGLHDGQLVTSGLYGWTMVVTGSGTNVGEAQAAAYARIGRVVIPNMRYRLDIGSKLVSGDLERMHGLLAKN